jgi:nucleoside phosphorylase
MDVLRQPLRDSSSGAARSEPPRRVLVVAAWEPELAHFRDLSGRRLAHLSHLTVETAAVGVGLAEAAVGMTQRIAALTPEPTLALFVGTCGSLASSLAIGDVVAGAAVELACADDAELPGPMAGAITLDAPVHDALVAAGARSARIANTLGVTVDDARARRLASRADVEHLEAFAFARACAAFGVRAGVVLGVANPVGASGREAWRANHVEASARAADVLAEMLVRTSTTAPSPAPP